MAHRRPACGKDRAHRYRWVAAAAKRWERAGGLLLLENWGDDGDSANVSPRQIITAILIHLVVPALGIAAFLRVRRVVRLQGKASGQGDSPVFVAELFCLFAVYGGWLMVLLTALFWQWSGMASLGTLFLLFGAPIPMIGIGWHLRSQQEKSVIHRRAFWASWGYTPLLLGVSILGVLVFALLGAWERS